MPFSPSVSPPTLVVYTDLDGTLLDAGTYSAAAALEALALLTVRGVPVVFCSSKSAAEQRALRRELRLEHLPYVVENGAAIYVPDAAGIAVADWPRTFGAAGERVCVLGRPFDEVKAGIGRVSARLGVRATGYAELSVAEVARVTGLDHAAATRARQRDYSETLIDAWPPELQRAWETALAAEGLCCRPGGRFHTVAGAEADKGRAVRLLTELYAAALGRPVRTVGLGDSENDTGLLVSVDRPYLLPKADGTWAPLEIPGVRRMARPGPQGWHDAVQDLCAADLLPPFADENVR